MCRLGESFHYSRHFILHFNLTGSKNDGGKSLTPRYGLAKKVFNAINASSIRSRCIRIVVRLIQKVWFLSGQKPNQNDCPPMTHSSSLASPFSQVYPLPPSFGLKQIMSKTIRQINRLYAMILKQLAIIETTRQSRLPSVIVIIYKSPLYVAVVRLVLATSSK